MLVLQRRIDESLVIDLREFDLGLIVVTVVSFRGADKVRLGIDADQAIPVDRWETWESKERERNGGSR